MLTVKHVEESGRESITTAKVVTFEPPDGDDDDSKLKKAFPRGKVIAFGVPQPVSDGYNQYGDGVVYVMNEAGATVSKYIL